MNLFALTPISATVQTCPLRAAVRLSERNKRSMRLPLAACGLSQRYFAAVRTVPRLVLKVLCASVVCIIVVRLKTDLPASAVRCKPESENVLARYQARARSPLPLSSEPLNWIDLEFTATPAVCSAGTVNDFIVIVHSDAEGFDERAYLREILQAKNIKTVFVVAESRMNDVDFRILAEANEFRDLLVVGNVVEHYHNITYKARAWIKWAQESCKFEQQSYIVKMDDDVHVDVDGVLRLLHDFRRHKNVVLCRVFEHGSVVRNTASKWYLSPEEYAHSTLGTYCQGMAYAFSADLLSSLHRNLKRVQYLWMDDWYVTNALLNGSNALYIDINKHFLSTNSEEELNAVLDGDSQERSKRVLFAHFRPAER